jgi:hypothetical protein
MTRRMLSENGGDFLDTVVHGKDRLEIPRPRGNAGEDETALDEENEEAGGTRSTRRGLLGSLTARTLISGQVCYRGRGADARAKRGPRNIAT